MNLITILFFSKNHILVVYDAREQGRNQDLNRGGGAAKLKTIKKFMKIETNIYFIFNKILHKKKILKHFTL